MKFKSNIEAQAGIEDSAASAGAAGQLLSSLGPVAGVDGVEWVDQNTIIASAATLVEIECKNTSGATIVKGTPVYQTGTVGATAVIEIAEADALISANKGPAIGLLQDTLINNAIGFVVIIGELLNFTTVPIDNVIPAVGDKIFVKSGGGLTTVKPTTSLNSIQAIGLVGKLSAGNSGSVTISSTMRANDVPNLPEGRIWIGDGNTIVSDTVYVDEPNNRVGIGTIIPTSMLEVDGVVTITDRLILSDSLKNSFIGENTGVNNTTGDENIGLGYNSLFSNTTGGNNTAIGKYSLYSNETGNYNIAIGEQALYSSTSSSNNIGIGFLSLYTNSSGFSNVGLGDRSLEKNTTGSANIAIGPQALWNNTTGASNSATGYWSLYANTTGDGNVAFGSNSLVSNTTGSYNVAMGANAGKWIANGTTTNATSENSIFIGRDTRANANSETNQIVIGNTVIGNGSNTVTLGNDSIVKTILKGNVGIGTPSPIGKLYVGSTWDTSSGGNLLYIKDTGTDNNSYDPQVTNTSDLGITMVRDSATTTGPDTVGLTLYNDDGTAGGFSPMLLFSKLETPTSQYKATMAGIYARSPLGTGNGGNWIDGELIFATAGAASQGIKQRMVINKEGNVGIGTTSPGERLTVTGNTILGFDENRPVKYDSASGNFRITPNAAGWAGGYFFNQTDGTYRGGFGGFGGNNTLDYFWIGDDYNDTTMVIEPGGGNVGIGTTSPRSNLDIALTSSEMVYPSSTGTSPKGGLRIGYNIASWGGVELNMGIANASAQGYPAWIQAQNPADLSVSRNLLLNPNGGNVGIGTTSPNAKLDVNGSATINNVLEVSDVDTGNPTASFNTVRLSGYGLIGNRGSVYLTNSDSNGLLQLCVGGSHSQNPKLVISSNNAYFTESLGIGTTNPTEKLYVNSISGDARIGLNAPTGSDTEIKFSNNGVVQYSIGHDDATDNFVIGTANVDTPKVSINKTGNVGIGTTTANVRLEIGGGSTLARVIPSVNNQGYIGDSSHRWQAIYATNGTIVTSDVREKEEIKSTQLGLDFVNDLNPVSFKWIDNERLDASKDKRNHQGLIAQEVAKTLEKHGVNKNEFGGLDIQKTDEYDDFHAMSYEQLIAPMIKAIQELKAEIEELKKQINK